MKYTIPISQEPNQTFNVELDGQRCVFEFITRGIYMFMNLTVNERKVIDGMICLNGVDLVQYKEFGFNGRLYFEDSTIVSRVLRATPPRLPADGLGRINALLSTESWFIRVLSPRILPLLRSEDGSMASTASFLPIWHRRVPMASMKVDLPAPGTPVIPKRIELPA